MSSVLFAIAFWIGAWALNGRLSRPDMARNRLVRLFIPALFGVTLLVLWQSATQRSERHQLALLLQRALRMTRGYARVFRVGQPAAWLLTGHYQYLRGERESAARSFTRSHQIARQLGMPFEAAQAQAWLGRLTRGAGGRVQLGESLATLQALGTPWEARQVEDWLAESATAAVHPAPP